LSSKLNLFEVQYSTNLLSILNKFEVNPPQIWGSILNKFDFQYSTNLRFKIQQIWGSILHKFEVQSISNLRFNTQQIWGSILQKFEVQNSTNLRFNPSQILGSKHHKFAPFWMKKKNIGTPNIIKSPFLWSSILLKFEVQYTTNLRFNTQQIWGSIHKFEV
jgi:hypothetical protein